MQGRAADTSGQLSAATLQALRQRSPKPRPLVRLDAALCGSSFVFSILAPDCLWEVPPFTPMPLAPAQVGVEELRVLSGGSVVLKPAGHAVQLGVGFRLEVSTALSGSQFRLARGLVGNIMSFS